MAMKFMELQSVIELNELARKENRGPVFKEEQPSTIQTAILLFNQYSEALRSMYDETDGVSGEINRADLDTAIMSADSSQASNEQKKKINKYTKTFKSYRETMMKLDKNGRTGWNGFMRFITNPYRYAKQKRLNFHLNHLELGIGEEYTHAEANDDKTKLLRLKDDINDMNKMEFLKMNNTLVSAIEELKNIRDYKMAWSAQGMRDNNRSIVETRADEEVYAYDDHSKFVTKSRMANAMQAARASGDIEKVRHLAHIQAQIELEAIFDARMQSEGIDKINQDVVVAYMGFNPSMYAEQLEAVNNNVTRLLELSDTRTRAEGLAGGANEELMDQENEFTGNNHVILTTLEENMADIPGLSYTAISKFVDTGVPTFCKFFGVKKTDFIEHVGLDATLLESIADNGITTNKDGDYTFKEKNLFGADEEHTMSASSTKVQLNYAAAMDTASAVFNLVGHVLKWIDIMNGFKESDRVKALGDPRMAAAMNCDYMMDAIENIMGLVDIIDSSVSAGYKFSTAAGATALEAAAKATNVLGYIGGAASILTNLLAVVKGINKQAYYKRAAKAAQDSGEQLEQLGADPGVRNKRFLSGAQSTMRRAKNAADKNKKLATTDAVTGTVQALAGITAFIPGASVIGSAIGAATSAASFVAKQLISSHFKGKNTDEAFMSLLNLSKEKYLNFKDRLGGREDYRFHNILRKKTGIATRTDYADALAVTNAIDLFAAARAYAPLNVGHLDAPTDPDQKVVKTAMEGLMFSKPEAYKNIQLKDILDRLDVKSDWRDVLKQAVTRNATFNIKEDMDGGRSKMILKGAYDRGDDAAAAGAQSDRVSALRKKNDYARKKK